MNSNHQPPPGSATDRLMRMAAARGMRTTYLGTVPVAGHGAEPVFDAKATRTIPKHGGVLPAGSPTRGHHVTVWGFVIEMLLHEPAPMLPSGKLSPAIVHGFATRAIWPVATIEGAIAFLRE